MKTGSLVVFVNSIGLAKWCIPLVKGKIYTVREICKRMGNDGLLLEEIHNQIFKNGEGAYRLDRFRELDTPTEINIEEIIELQEV